MNSNKQPILFLFVLVFLFFNVTWVLSEKTTVIQENSQNIQAIHQSSTIKDVYDSLRLDAKGLSEDAYQYAIKGFHEVAAEGLLKNDSILTIVDFDQPSYQKRMYIIDVKNYKILFNTWTAHGRNTGKEMAVNFSNQPNSYKSSLGVYVTEDTYFGNNGYSLRLIGLDKTNSNAANRAIVLHGAPYVSQSTINAMGYIGRSHGCPAVPRELTKPIIEKIKGGSCFFIYNKSYQHTS